MRPHRLGWLIVAALTTWQLTSCGGNTLVSPTITRFEPATANAGGNAFVLQILGDRFQPTTTVTWNGAVRDVTFVTGSEVRIAITADDLSSQTTASVTVRNLEGGVATASFVVGPPTAPILKAVSPLRLAVGDPATIVTIRGANFTRTSVVQVNSIPRTTTYVSNTELKTTLRIEDLATGTTHKVVVATPDSTDAKVSASADLIVAYPQPIVSALTPSSATFLEKQFDVIVSGSGFVDGAVVRWNYQPQTTTFLSGTQLKFTAPVALPATDVTADAVLTVSNPAPNNGSSAEFHFPIVITPPTITSVSARRAIGGDPIVNIIAGEYIDLAVSGTGFTTWSQFWLDNEARLLRNLVDNENILATGIRIATVGTHWLTSKNWDVAPQSAPFGISVMPAGAGIQTTDLGKFALDVVSPDARFMSDTNRLISLDTCVGAPSGCIPGPFPQSQVISNGGKYIVYHHDTAISGAQEQPSPTAPPKFTSTLYWEKTCYQGGDSCQPTRQEIWSGVVQASVSYGARALGISRDGRFVAYGMPAEWVSSGFQFVRVADTCQGGPDGCQSRVLDITPSNLAAKGNSALTPDGRFLLYFTTRSPGYQLKRVDTCITAPTSCVPNSVDIGEPIDSATMLSNRVAISADGKYILGPNAELYEVCSSGGSCVPSVLLAADPRFSPSSMGLSEDARYLVFIAKEDGSTGVVENDNNYFDDVFVTDTCIGAPVGCLPRTLRGSLSPAGEQFVSDALLATISGDGQHVLYTLGKRGIDYIVPSVTKAAANPFLQP